MRRRDEPPPIHATALDRHFGTNRIAIRHLPHQIQTHPVAPRGRVVSKEASRSVVLDQDEVEVAIAVVVEVSATATDDRREAFAARERHQFERLLVAACVAEQLRGLLVGLARLRGRDVRFEVPVAGEQIEAAIAVEVGQQGTELHRRTARPREPHLRGNVREARGLLAGSLEERVRFVREVGHDRREVSG